MSDKELELEIEALRAVAKGRTTLAVQLKELDLLDLGLIRKSSGRLILTRRGIACLKE